MALALARFVFAYRDDFDAILVTGDLSDWGHPADFVAAKQFLFAPVGTDAGGRSLLYLANDKKPTLQGKRSNCPIYVMPGNHDRYTNQRGHPGGAEFESAFGPQWDHALAGTNTTPVNDGVRTIFITDNTARHTLAVVCADCCLRTADVLTRGKRQILGQGLVTPGVLTRLQVETDAARKIGGASSVVWAISFSAGSAAGRAAAVRFR